MTGVELILMELWGMVALAGVGAVTVINAVVDAGERWWARHQARKGR